MFNKQITRKDFLKIVFVGIAALCVMPILKLFRNNRGTAHKEARYYKRLAG